MKRLKLLSTAIATAMLLCLPPARHAIAGAGAGASLDGAATAPAYR